MIEIFHRPNFDFIGRRRWPTSSRPRSSDHSARCWPRGLRYGIDSRAEPSCRCGSRSPGHRAKIRPRSARSGWASIIQEFGDSREYIIRLPLARRRPRRSRRRSRRRSSANPRSGKIEIRRVEFVGPQVGRSCSSRRSTPCCSAWPASSSIGGSLRLKGGRARHRGLPRRHRDLPRGHVVFATGVLAPGPGRLAHHHRLLGERHDRGVRPGP